MGVFDEGCMGMFNAIIPDDLLNPTGVYKERLSQSALYYETTQVSDAEATAVRQWMEERGMKFDTGPDHEEDLTDEQILPAVQDVHRRAAHRRRFRLRHDRHPVSAGAEGPAAGQRPGRRDAQQRRSSAGPQPRRQRVLYAGEPLPHFNEVDECAGLDGADDLSRPQGAWASRSRTRCTICAGAIGTARARSTTTCGCF